MSGRDLKALAVIVTFLGIMWAGQVLCYRMGFNEGQKSSCQELADDAFRSGKAMGHGDKRTRQQEKANE